MQPGSMHSRVADASHVIHTTGFGDSNLPLSLITCPFISKLQRSCSFIIIINKLEVVFYCTVLKPMHDQPTELIKFTNKDRSFFYGKMTTQSPHFHLSHIFIYFLT